MTLGNYTVFIYIYIYADNSEFYFILFLVFYLQNGCFRNLNDSFVVIVMTNKNAIKSIIESSSTVRVSHFIIIPLDGPLPPKPGTFLNER